MRTTQEPILLEGWYPPRETGFCPSFKASWNNRTLQLFADDLEQAEHDMRLVAAAPSMLKALEWIKQRLERGGKAAVSDAISQCDAEIWKAKGEHENP